MPIKLQKMFLEAFSQLPQRVLWKFEKKMELPVPENVLVTPWLPQQDLLGEYKITLLLGIIFPEHDLVIKLSREKLDHDSISLNRRPEIKGICDASWDAEFAGGGVARRPCHIGAASRRSKGECSYCS
jgi:hypothetical protein